ncbi:hydrolase [Halapricum salinum]|uniref:Hydrolase n=2 Tax=Halapricum salinum TaxID=1457250 RepID=A0A4D6HIC3_9EURY|nr:hydrolase [Halapricum salinum]
MPAAHAEGDMQWRGAEIESQAGRPDPEEWTPVDVPGRPERFAGSEAVAYKTVVEDPTTATEPHAVLELSGCYAETTVWCNGTELATHDTYFEPLRVRLDDYLTPETELVVVCRRPADGGGGVYETDLLPDAATVPGIWWDATLRTYQGTYFDRLTGTPRIDGTEGTIDVQATVVATEAIDDRLTFSVRPAGDRRERGMMERASIEAAAGERVTVEHSIPMRDPSLWWPHDLGEQNRYVVTAKLDGVEKATTVGFCEFDHEDGEVTINGTETTARGLNLLDSTPEDVERAVEANATLVRTHAHLPSPAVVDACERAGVLLWVDLPQTGSQRVSVDRGRELAAAVGRQYSRAASLSAVTVHDDPVDPFDTPLGSGFLDRLRFRWRAWRASYDAGDARSIAETLPDDVERFPVVGPPGIDADGTTLYPGWRYGSATDLDWLLDRHPDIDAVAEFGAGALATDSVQEPAGFDRRVHDTHTDGGDVAASQRYQATVVKRVAEGLRNAGVPLLAGFALRDSGDAGMGVLSRDGDRKRAFDALASAYEPIQATLADPGASESDVLVHNALDTRFTGELQWESPAGSGSTEVTIDTNARAALTTIELPAEGAVTLTLSTADRTVENTYALG